MSVELHDFLNGLERPYANSGNVRVTLNLAFHAPSQVVESIVRACDIEGAVGLDAIMGNAGSGRDICAHGHEFAWHSGVVNL